MCFKICSAGWGQGRAHCKHARLTRVLSPVRYGLWLYKKCMNKKKQTTTTDKHTTYTSLWDLRCQEMEGENGHIGHTHAFRKWKWKFEGALPSWVSWELWNGHHRRRSARFNPSVKIITYSTVRWRTGKYTLGVRCDYRHSFYGFFLSSLCFVFLLISWINLWPLWTTPFNYVRFEGSFRPAPLTPQTLPLVAEKGWIRIPYGVF